MDAFGTELAGLELADRLEDRNDIDFLAFRPDARKDAAAVEEDARNIEPGHGHDAARHVLVAAAHGNQAVVIHAAGDDLQTVGNYFARHQAIAHAVMPHHDAVGRRWR